MLTYARRYSENNMKLTDLIKTTTSDLEYPVWPAGKAPWAVEKGGSGVAPVAPGARNRRPSFAEDIKPEISILSEKLSVPTDDQLSNLTPAEAEQMIAVARKMIEMATRSKFSGLKSSEQNLVLDTIDSVLLRNNIKLK